MPCWCHFLSLGGFDLALALVQEMLESEVLLVPLLCIDGVPSLGPARASFPAAVGQPLLLHLSGQEPQYSRLALLHTLYSYSSLLDTI